MDTDKIFGNKELAACIAAAGPSLLEQIPVVYSRTIPLWSFCIVGKGHSSQSWTIFGPRLWKKESRLGTAEA